MKTLHLFSVLTLLFIIGLTINLSGQTKTATPKSEKIFINKKGEIHDHGGTKLGFITKDDIVKNNQGKTIYFIDRNGNVIDANGKNLGKAQKNGNYFNVNGNVKSWTLRVIPWVPFIKIISCTPVLRTA